MTQVTTDGPGLRNIVLSALGGATLTVALAWGSWWLAESPGSDFPAWLSAWATVFGVAAAIVAGFYAARAFSLEFRREQRWSDEQRIAQASVIAAWVSDPIVEHGPGHAISDPKSAMLAVLGVDVRVRNASQLPVTAVVVDVFMIVTHGEHALEYLPLANGEDSYMFKIGVLEIPVLAPSTESKEWRIVAREPIRFSELGITETTIARMTTDLSIRFTDSAGRRWERTRDGLLLEVERLKT